MNIGIITDGYIDWNGGLDFLKIVMRGLDSRENTKLFLFFISENERKYRHVPVGGKKLIEKLLPYKQNSSICNFSEFKNAEIVNYRMSNIARKIKEYDIDVIFPSMIDLGKNMPVKWCLELFDCQHKYFPQYFSIIRRNYRDFFYKRAMSHSNMVMVNSIVAKNDFSSFYNVDSNKIYSLPLCPTLHKDLIGNDNPAITAKYNISKPFFIISNQFWVHKAHDTAFMALAKLIQRGYDICIVCTGFMSDYRGNEHIEYLLRLIKGLNIENNVMLLGFIPKKDQIELMKESLGVIQPSRYEGDCSGQVIDAITVGQRAIVSDIDVCKEVSYIDTLSYFKLDDVDDLAKKMMSFVETPYSRPSLETLYEQEARYKKEFSDYLFCMIEKLLA